MEATAAYPQWPPLLVSTGLGGAVVSSTPDRVPLQPFLVNDPRQRLRQGGVDADGGLQLFLRNSAGHSYLRPAKRTRFKGVYHSSKFAQREASYFYQHHREFVPRSVLHEHLETSIREERDSMLGATPKWQGNTLTGIETVAREHAVFFPTGEILQQACVFRHARDRRRPRVSNTVECGAVIRQFELLGSRETYDLYGETTVRAIARGAANCTVLEATVDGDSPELKILESFRFDEMAYHVAGSPHGESDAAIVTDDGSVHLWDPVSGVQRVMTEKVAVNDRFLRCEYTSHPCVLWTANRYSVSTLDLRQAGQASQTLFDLNKFNAASHEIYAIKRRQEYDRSPFQCIVGSSVSIELIDTRMRGKSLIAWTQRSGMDTATPYYGALEEISWCSSSRSDQGLVLSSTQGHKSVSVYPFARHADKKASVGSTPFLLISPLRSSEDASDRTRIAATQYIASDAPLDLNMRDGGEWTSLFGMCVLVNNKRASNASVYLLNDLGDLYCQTIRPSDEGEVYDTAVQLELPCGSTAQVAVCDRNEEMLPLPVDAVLPEHDAESLTPFATIPISIMLKKYPRLPPSEDAATEQNSSCLIEALNSLRLVCRPSATLFRLHRYMNDELQIPISSQSLLQLLRACPELHVRSVHHRFQQPRARVLDPVGHRLVADEYSRDQDDARLAACACCPQTTSTPCASASCILPHALIVSSSAHVHAQGCFPMRRQQLSDDYATMLASAKELYDH